MSSSEHQARLHRIGLSLPEVLMPAPHVDLQRWIVAACDQHVHDGSYWRRARERVGAAPSALSMVLPESDLDSPDLQAAIASIHASMERLSAAGALRPCAPGMVVVRREEPGKGDRVGLLVCFDLEARRDERRALALRPTESVVEERMPAREAIRRDAILEIPHLLALADDGEGVLQEALEQVRGGEIYYVGLPESRAIVRASHVAPPAAELLVDALESVAARHGGDAPYPWFVGDGNHSLEAAHRRWEALRPLLHPEARLGHPARFAMGELVPFASPGIEILPVLRQARGVSVDELLRLYLAAGLEPHPCPREELRAGPGGCGLVASERAWRLSPRGDAAERIAAIDSVLASQRRRNPSMRTDFLHGWGEAASAADDAVLVVVPTFARDELRGIFQRGGLCPRKSFSLGGPADKRHYLEARSLREAVAGER